MKRLIIVGGNRLRSDNPIKTIVEIAKKKNIEISLITDFDHIKKKVKNGTLFKEFLKKNKVNYSVVKDINKLLAPLKKNNCHNILLCVGSIWKINETILKSFKNNCYNYHIGLLPEQSGAGGATWIKLSNKKSSALTFHELTKKIDSGRILLEKKFKFKSCFTISEYYNVVTKLEKSFFQSGINLMFKKEKKIKHQIKKNRFYMPRLDTKTHGYIDWTWSSKEIVDFISAFGKPHEGAKTYIKNKKIFLTSECKRYSSFLTPHPFQYGIVYKKDNKFIYVLVKDGSIKIKLDSSLSANARLGSRFYTPIKYLDRAMLYRATF